MKTKLLLAEEFRPESDGKQMALGIFPDDIVILVEGENRPEATPAQPHALERLAFLFNITDISDGKHTFKGQILNPSGAPHGPEIPMGELTVSDKTSATLIVAAKPFVVPEFGVYQFNLYVDGIQASHSFEIRLRPKSVTAAA